MFKVCDEYRLILSILAGMAGIVATVIFPMVLGPNIVYAFNKLVRASNLGEKPPRKSPFLWILFYISLALAVVLGSVIAVSPTRACTAVTITQLICNPPGRDSEGEFVTMQNTGTKQITLNDWTLCDAEDNHCYTFPKFILAPGAEVKLWTRVGQNSETELFWGETTSIWNNSGDTARLRTEQGETISELSCSD